MRNEWGLIVRPATRYQGPSPLRLFGLGATTPSTPMAPATTGLIGAGIGAIAGGLGERMVMKGSGLAGVAIGAVVGGGAGYYYGKSQQPATGGAGRPNPVTNASTLDIVLAPGTMTPIALSLSGDNAISFTLPTGATGGINLLSAAATIVSTSGMTMQAPATAQAVAQGSTTLQAAWTDANGQNQSSTISVTVGP